MVQPMNAGAREQLESIVNLVNAVHPRMRAALAKIRQDDNLLMVGVDYVNHIERELTEAMNRLDGARFGAEALLAKLLADVDRAVRPVDVPLRRLILKVVQHGEQVSVTEVLERLAGLGSYWSAPKVSNALGYWVRRGDLVRLDRGVYSRSGNVTAGSATSTEGDTG
jgi:hypothetical protein